MSLDYNITNVPEDVRIIVAESDNRSRGYRKGDRIMNPVTETIIFMTVVTGIGELTDETIPEFQARLDFIYALTGQAELLAFKDGEDEPTEIRITREDLERHKGLSTNVFPIEKRAAWTKRQLKYAGPFVGVAEPKTARRG